MGNVARVHTEIAESDHESILNFVKENKVEWVVVGPEQPLIDGLSDKLHQSGVKVFGPNKDAAQIEGSKLFAKKLCKNIIFQQQNIKKLITKQMRWRM